MKKRKMKCVLNIHNELVKNNTEKYVILIIVVKRLIQVVYELKIQIVCFVAKTATLFHFEKLTKK
jgi:hypothetical protein